MINVRVVNNFGHTITFFSDSKYDNLLLSIDDNKRLGTDHYLTDCNGQPVLKFKDIFSVCLIESPYNVELSLQQNCIMDLKRQLDGEKAINKLLNQQVTNLIDWKTKLENICVEQRVVLDGMYLSGYDRGFKDGMGFNRIGTEQKGVDFSRLEGRRIE